MKVLTSITILAVYVLGLAWLSSTAQTAVDNRIAHTYRHTARSVWSSTTMGPLLAAMEKVESNGNTHAVGDDGAALGCLQIHQVMVDDYNNHHHRQYTHKDVLRKQVSRVIALWYLKHYGALLEVQLGRELYPSELAAMWNGGPQYKTKDMATKARIYIYVRKVIDTLKKSRT